MAPDQSPLQATFDFAVPHTAIVPFGNIRIASVIAMFTIHTLSKTGKVDICIINTGEHRDSKLLWNVTPNPAYGEPRALAYKLDTLVIIRTLEEIGRPLFFFSSRRRHTRSLRDWSSDVCSSD